MASLIRSACRRWEKRLDAGLVSCMSWYKRARRFPLTNTDNIEAPSGFRSEDLVENLSHLALIKKMLERLAKVL